MPGSAVGLVRIGHDLGKGTVRSPPIGGRRGVVDGGAREWMHELEAAPTHQDQTGGRLGLFDRVNSETESRRGSHDLSGLGSARRGQQQQHPAGVGR